MIFQSLIDLNAAIDMIDNPIFINDISGVTKTELSAVLEGTTTTYDNRDGNDQISLLSKCQCGYLSYYNASKKVYNYICPKCNVRPTSQLESFVRSTHWFRKPEGITKLMNPLMFTMLYERFNLNGWNAIALLTDPYYKCNNKRPAWLEHLERQNFGRGWNNFIAKFDEIMTFLLGMTVFKVEKGSPDYLLFLLNLQADKVFCDVLPVPNRIMFPYEKTNFCIYRSNSAGFASAFIQGMLSIDSPIQKLSQKARESRLAKMYRSITEYQNHHIKHEISPKEGDIRRHNLGTKTVFSGRAIIISRTGPQDHQQIGIPWFMALGAFRPILINKLRARGFSQNSAVNLLRASTACFNPILSGIMDEMIAEAHDGKLWCLYDRNPSLKHGSIQLGEIYFKRDPTDKCIDFPIPNVKSPNAEIRLES